MTTPYFNVRLRFSAARLRSCGAISIVSRFPDHVLLIFEPMKIKCGLVALHNDRILIRHGDSIGRGFQDAAQFFFITCAERFQSRLRSSISYINLRLRVTEFSCSLIHLLFQGIKISLEFPFQFFTMCDIGHKS